MDGADVTPAAWSLVRGFFSPATLFLLLNVVIGTIALTSRSQRRRQHHHGDDGHHQPQRQYQQRQRQEEEQGYSDQYAPPAPLARTSSVMERLRSLGLYRFRSGDFPPEYNYNLSAATSTVDGDDESGKQQQQQQAQYARSRSEPAARPPMDRTGNKEEKAAKAKVAKKPISEVKRLERTPAPVSEVKRLQRAPAPAHARVVHRAQAPVSDVSLLERAPAPAQARVMHRAPRAPARAAAAREDAKAPPPEAAAPACVDERADDFINKFRQQLQLQRLNSLLNYKEMLNRGT